MKILGSATVLAPAATKFNTSTSVYVFNTDTAEGILTLVDDADSTIGTVYIGPRSGLEISLELGQGLRGPITMYGTQIASTGY